jgi:hypothetical protein
MLSSPGDTQPEAPTITQDAERRQPPSGRFSRVGWLLVVLLLAGCAERVAEPVVPVAPEWTRAWSGRLADYDREATRRAAMLERDFGDLAAFLVRRPLHRSGLRAALVRYTETLVGLARIEGRAEILGRFSGLARDHPSAGKLRTLIAIEGRELARRDRASRPRLEAFVSAYENPVLPYRAWLDDLTSLAREGGGVGGGVEELLVIAGELEAVAEGARAIDELVALNGSIASYASSKRLVRAFKNPRTCTGIGVRLSCY